MTASLNKAQEDSQDTKTLAPNQVKFTMSGIQRSPGGKEAGKHNHDEEKTNPLIKTKPERTQTPELAEKDVKIVPVTGCHEFKNFKCGRFRTPSQDNNYEV